MIVHPLLQFLKFAALNSLCHNIEHYICKFVFLLKTTNVIVTRSKLKIMSFHKHNIIIILKTILYLEPHTTISFMRCNNVSLHIRCETVTSSMGATFQWRYITVMLFCDFNFNFATILFFFFFCQTKLIFRRTMTITMFDSRNNNVHVSNCFYDTKSIFLFTLESQAQGWIKDVHRD